MYEQIWAPWRHAYIESEKAPGSQEAGCFLCAYRDENRDEENLVVSRSSCSLAVLNRFPYNNGHLLVAPLTHQGTFEELTDAEHLACLRQLRDFIEIYGRVLKPDGFNIGLNVGHAAGAGLPGHLHWHLVPRWNGDTNFMTVVDDVRVVSQSLKALYARLRSQVHSGR